MADVLIAVAIVCITAGLIGGIWFAIRAACRRSGSGARYQILIPGAVFKAAVAALGLAVALAGAAAAGQFKDAEDAARRGDYPTAIKLLGPFAERGDAGGVSGLKFPSPLVPFPFPLIMPLIEMAAAVGIVAIAYGVVKLRIRARRARIDAAIAKYEKSLPVEAIAEMERSQRVAGERPWEPIDFRFDSVTMVENGFELNAAGVHRGHAFGFGIGFKMAYGPVAVCEWRPKGSASDALLDILAEYAEVPRGNSRFDDFFKAGALILSAVPSNAPFWQLRQLNSKIFFELAEGQPEIYLNFDFPSKTGTIMEKDPIYRRSLVHAFQP
jgi:hypothetical protein